jgi:hypothetical protein
MLRKRPSMPKPIPSKLYRYTAIGEYTERIFLRRELYFSDSTAFNDPFDCRMSYSTECSEVAFRKLTKPRKAPFRPVIEQRYPHMSYDDAVSQAYKDRDSLVSDTAKKALDAHAANTGLCCFTELNDNILMWSHYAAHHRGICVEFSTAKSRMFESVRPIVYTKKCPVFECFSRNLSLIAKRALFRKAPNWAYEREWRLLWKPANEARVFQPGTLSSVFLGARISDANATQVISWCKAIRPRPKVYRAELMVGTYGLSFVPEPLIR